MIGERGAPGAGKQTGPKNEVLNIGVKNFEVTADNFMRDREALNFVYTAFIGWMGKSIPNENNIF